MEKIRELFNQYLNENGFGAAKRLIAEHGGNGTDIETIPPERLGNFAKALGLMVADHAELTGHRDDLPKSLDVSDSRFADFHRRAFDRFNGRGHA